jgi:hypothetical protein
MNTKIEYITESGAESLIEAIIVRACKDYRLALKSKDKSKIISLERFFKGDYFGEMTNYKISGDWVIRTLKSEVLKDE